VYVIFNYNTTHFLMEINRFREFMLMDAYQILCTLYTSTIPPTQNELQQNQVLALNYMRNTDHCDGARNKQFTRIFNAYYFFEQSCIDTSILFKREPIVIYNYMIANGYE